MASSEGTSARFSIFYGGLSFGVVSLLAYSIWAFRRTIGEATMYTSIATVYIGFGGIALSRLVRPFPTFRFAGIFGIAFLIYAIVWCVFWFGLGRKHHADLWGSVVALAGMVCMLRRGLNSKANFLPLFGVLFAFHTIGYYLGDVLYATVGRSAGRLLWGAAHGVGFGAGLGYVLSECRSVLQPDRTP